MKSFGFRKQTPKARYGHLHIGFSIICVIAFFLFSIGNQVKQTVLATPAQTLFEEDMGELALYVSTYDPRAASVLLSMQRVIQGYKRDNFLITYKGDIENILQYLSNNPQKFAQLGLQQYTPFLQFLAGLSNQKDDIFSLLGAERPQTYLIALQNGAEKRPNGGFFGSFVKITLFDAKITDLQFIDSYVPGIIRPDVSLQAPEWSNIFLSGDDTINFLASNKFGFTDMDGKNIKRLYDLTYTADIRGVIFVNSNLFSDLVPGFQQILWEWQFKNAAIDLIRGEALPNKKELYFDGVKTFLQKNQMLLIKAITKHFDLIKENRYIQAHLVRINEKLPQFLQEQGLQTVFNNNHIYLWDYNSSYNKIDTFIEKTVSILDSNNHIVAESIQDVIAIDTLLPGKYTLHVQYTMSIPQEYLTYIDTLTKQFRITLNLREKHILAIYPQRSTRGVIYAPQHITFGPVEGPTKTDQLFETPFSHNAFYILENTENHKIKEITVPFIVGEK